jgi:hypothetical protein
MCHLQSCSFESTFYVEAFVRFTTIQNTLVTTYFLGDEIEGLDDFETEFLSLLVFRDGYIFDVTDKSEIVDTMKTKVVSLAPLFSHTKSPTLEMETAAARKRTISFPQSTPQFLRCDPRRRLPKHNTRLSPVCSSIHTVRSTLLHLYLRPW